MQHPRIIRAPLSIFAALLCAMTVACDGPAPREESQPVVGLLEALAAEVAACGRDFEACASASGGDVAACREGFTACRASAGQSQLGAMAACGRAAGECFAAAAGPDGADACRDDLAACVGAGGGQLDAAAPDLPDAAAGAGSGGMALALVLGDCNDALGACIEGDDDAAACANAARDCVTAAVPAPAGAIPALPTEPGAPVDLPTPPDVPAPADPGTPQTPAADAGMAAEPPVDATTCMDSYDVCIAGGGGAAECGRQLRECGRP